MPQKIPWPALRDWCKCMLTSGEQHRHPSQTGTPTPAEDIWEFREAVWGDLQEARSIQEAQSLAKRRGWSYILKSKYIQVWPTMLTRACHTHFRDAKKMTMSNFSCIPIAQWCSLSPWLDGSGGGRGGEENAKPSYLKSVKFWNSVVSS